MVGCRACCPQSQVAWSEDCGGFINGGPDNQNRVTMHYEPGVSVSEGTSPRCDQNYKAIELLYWSGLHWYWASHTLKNWGVNEACHMVSTWIQNTLIGAGNIRTWRFVLAPVAAGGGEVVAGATETLGGQSESVASSWRHTRLQIVRSLATLHWPNTIQPASILMHASSGT